MRAVGVASGLVNTVQQVGGSIGIAFLSTVAASAGQDFVRDNLTAAPASAAGRAVFEAAAAQGCSAVYWYGATIFAVGAILTALCLPAGVIEPDEEALAASRSRKARRRGSAETLLHVTARATDDEISWRSRT